MRLGIDFGSRWIVAAVADRGNYPLVSFEGEQTGLRNYFPPLIAANGAGRIYGWDAWTAISDAPAIDEAPPVAACFWNDPPNSDLLTEIASALHAALDNSLSRDVGERYEIVLGVPAQAGETHRSCAREAFGRAGFDVSALMTEPVADSLEYKIAHSRRGNILVCHLGARLSSASIINLDETHPRPIASEPLDDLTADQFDMLLAELAIDSAAVALSGCLPPVSMFRLREECRNARESLQPSAHRFVVDLGNVVHGGEVVSVSMEAVQERWQQQLDRTVEAIERLLTTFKNTIHAIYVTGEASELLSVVHRFRDAFGDPVCRAANGRATTAIGLAVAADQLTEDKPNADEPHPPLAGRTPDIEPEHWLSRFITELTRQFHSSGGNISFNAASELLKEHEREYIRDAQITRRMLRLYPNLFK